VLTDLEHRLHPWSTYLVVPVFALANAGVPLSASTLSSAVASRLTWAVVVGLVVGKIVGISAAAWAAVRTRVGRLPPDVRLGHLVGTGGLGGIGFTVSLFVTGLAFTSETLQREAKVGILLGSLLAAVVGVAVLLRQPPAGSATSSGDAAGNET
jgi:Na+/H+ antiporter NhaA